MTDAVGDRRDAVGDGRDGRDAVGDQRAAVGDGRDAQGPLRDPHERVLRDTDDHEYMVRDTDDHRRVLRADSLFDGRIFDVVGDTVELAPGAPPVRREYLVHPGAVAIVALRGTEDAPEVLLVSQYRHASRARLHEIPAGLLDVPGEDPVAAARRELAEEADLVAGRWDVLTDTLLSPGATNECVRVLLARDLTSVPDAERHEREDEEAEMVPVWVPLADAVTAVLDGRLHNGATTVGILAAETARQRDWAGLRPADAPWELRRYRSADGSLTSARTGLPPEHR